MSIAFKVTQSSGTKVYINGELQSSNTMNLLNMKLPLAFYTCYAVVYRGEIHLLGGEIYGSYYKYHYKFNGKSWESVSTIPSSGVKGACVINDEIHIITMSNHYKWDGNEWTLVSTLPIDVTAGSIVVKFNNEIHILGFESGTKHYKWDGTSWVSVSTIPYSVKYGSAVEYNNQLHLFGGEYQNAFTKHSVWDGTSWVEQTSLSERANNSNCVVKDNKIYLFVGRAIDRKTSGFMVYDGTEWSSVTNMTITSYLGTYVVFNNDIFYTGGICAPYYMFKLSDETVLYQE